MLKGTRLVLQVQRSGLYTQIYLCYTRVFDNNFFSSLYTPLAQQCIHESNVFHTTRCMVSKVSLRFRIQIPTFPDTRHVRHNTFQHRPSSSQIVNVVFLLLLSSIIICLPTSFVIPLNRFSRRSNQVVMSEAKVIAPPTFRSRISNVFRSTRTRIAIVLIGGYQLYEAASNYNTIYKPYSGHRHRPGQTVLDLNLDSVTIVQHEALRPFSSSEEMRLERLISTLRAAKGDPRVTGLVVRGLSGIGSIGLAELTELRDAISDFSSGWGGKHTMLHVPDGFGLAGNGTVPLYFASAFDSVHVQPSSAVIIPGLSLATLFFKRLLDNVGLKAQKVARKDYKTAANSFTEDKFTHAHKESTQSLLDAIMHELIEGIANGRHISKKAVRDAIDIGIMTPKQAHEIGLVDEPLNRDQLPKEMRHQLREKAAGRTELRKKAEVEWRSAMDQLVNAWNEKGGITELFRDGTVDANLSNFNFAVPMSVTVTDRQQEDIKKIMDAEILALKAHIQWLDTCPWEPLRRDYEQVIQTSKFMATENKKAPNDKEKNLYDSIPYVSALLNLERRLCEHAIRTLEEFPKVVDLHRTKSEDGTQALHLDVKGSFEVVRWVRSVWKAKSMAHRMVETISDVRDSAKKSLQIDDDKEKESAVEEYALRPRPFLVGFVEDLKPYKLSTQPNDENDESEINTNVNGSKSKESSDGSNEELKVSIEHKDQNGINLDGIVVGEDEESPKLIKKDIMKLRYMRLADYSEMVNNEQRAYAERSDTPIRMETSNPYPFLHGMIDGQDRHGLVRLSSAGVRFAPWRLNVSKGHLVAVIHVDGVISDEMADKMRSSIRRADKDSQVKAIVLRIDSPGGSAIASDIIARAVDVARKPVVASMGSTCASGGYYIAAPCKMVFASPTTITGSIGVLLQSFNTSELFERLGITGDSIESGKFAKYFGALSSVTEWSEDFSKKIDEMIDVTYEDFVGIVAKGRGMEKSEVENAAQGRVWAGSEAIELKLVDKMGGLQDAVQAAAELAHLAPDEAVRAVDYPTLSMLVADAAKRRGFIPAQLDEEGDELGPERRRRRWPWSRHKDEEGSSDNSLYSELNGTDGEEQEQDAGLQSAPATALSMGMGSYFLNKLLLGLDNMLISIETPSLTSRALSFMLGRAAILLNGRAEEEAIAKQLEIVRATNGRPAAIAPIFKLDE